MTASTTSARNSGSSFKLGADEKDRYLNFMHKEINRKIYNQLKKSELSDSLKANVERPLLASDHNFQAARGPILPEPLKKILRENSKKTNVGFFPHIDYSYFIQGAQIFLWNLTHGKYHYLQNPSGDIQAASLIKPKKDIFPAEVHYLLALASNSGVHLFGLSLNSEVIEVYMTDYYTEVSSQEITCITGSESGRIFLGSAGGDILEFIYQKESSFLWDKCSITNHSKTPLSRVTSFLNIFTSENKILSLAIDESRKTLYVLRQDSSIQIYSLGNDGDEFGFKGKLDQYKQLAQKALSLSSDSLISATVAIHAIQSTESNCLRLIAVTAGGVVILFKSNKSANLECATGLEFATALPSTYEALCKNDFNGHVSFYNRGCFVLSAPYQEKSSSLSITFLDKAPGQTRDKELLLCSSLKFEETFFDVTEIPSHDTTYFSPRVLPFLTSFDDLNSQYYISYRKFCFLGTQGALFLHKLRPIDQLHKILTSQDSQGQHMKQFLERYGASETCCMLLSFLSKYPLAYKYANNFTPSSFSSPKFSSSDAFLEKCLLFINEISGRPSFEQESRGYSHDKDHIRPLLTQPFNFSNVFYGLLLFCSRLLCPVWNIKLFTLSLKNGIEHWEITLDDKLLKLLRDTLLNLSNSLVKISLFSQNQVSGLISQTQASNINSLNAFKNEREALEQLKEILHLSSQVLGFVSILHECKINEYINKGDPIFLNQLKSVSFEYLLASPSRHNIINELVKILINSRSFDEKKAYISDILLSKCKDIYETGNLPMVKGFEFIREAECQFTIQEVTLKLKKALDFFSQTKRPIPLEQLKDILKKYCQLGFQIGALILIVNNVLKFSAEELKSNHPDVASYYQAVDIPLDSLLPHLKSVAISGLDSKIASEILPNLKLILSTAENDMFHEVIYNWFIKNNLYIILYNVCSPRFEAYVSKSNLNDKTDIIYTYYCTTGKYLKAAKLMLDLATSSQSQKLSLNKKVEYLSKALVHSEKPIADEDLSIFFQLKRNIKTIYETAMIQLLILKEYETEHKDQIQEMIINQLNKNLFSIEKLYSLYVVPLNLTKSKQVMLSKGYVTLTGIL